MKARHEPQRSCVACRETRDQRELVRLVYGESGLAIDNRRRSPGRGAYLCRRRACWERTRLTSQAKGGGALSHALRATMNDDDRATLEAFERGLSDDTQTAERPAATAASGGESGTV